MQGVERGVQPVQRSGSLQSGRRQQVAFSVVDDIPVQRHTVPLQARAELYAKAMGYRVARLVTFSEGGGYSPRPPVPMYARAEAMSMDASTQVAPGELTVRIDITGVYDLR